ncbi:MAG: hypothetical protein ABWW69_02310 [Pyrodictiaceae archaeon]
MFKLLCTGGRIVLENQVDPLWYYSRSWVQEEISGFLRGRWAGLESKNRRWVRWLGDKPLRIEKPSDIYSTLLLFKRMGARSFYGTIEVFRRLEDRSDVEDRYWDNVIYATPFIDIDLVDETSLEEAWECVVDVARILYDVVCGKHGVCKSIYLVWSGAGMHFRINEKAFSRTLLEKHHPLEVAFAVSELVMREASQELKKMLSKCTQVKAESLVAPKRVFTAPLSLHRRLDRVAVPISPDDLDSFSLEWTNPYKPRYKSNVWLSYVEGEADDLAIEALHTIKEAKHTVLAVKQQSQEHSTMSSSSSRGGRVKGVGRFQVMALLQAARYYILYGGMEHAKSYGLNRAIFYAWAKQNKPQASRIAGPRHHRSSVTMVGSVSWKEIAGERVQVSPEGWFVMGGVEQKPEDFDKNVARKFEEAGISFEEAWRAALEYLKKFPVTVLKDPQRFYKEVYEPVRDRFIDKVLRARSNTSSQGLLKWLGKHGDKG